MIKQVGDKVKFTIDSKELIRSIALIEEMKEICEEHQDEEGAAHMIEPLTGVIEVLKAFYCEKFPEEDDGSV